MQERIIFNVDWGKYNGYKSDTKSITLQIGVKKYPVKINVGHYADLHDNYFFEKNGFAVAYAKNYHHKNNMGDAQWEELENLGYSGTLMQANPLNAIPLDTINIERLNPKLSYIFNTETITNSAQIVIGALPTHPLTGNHKVRIGIQWADQPVQIVNFQTYDRSEQWKENVLRNLATITVPVALSTTGKHTLNIYMIDQGVSLDFIYLKTKAHPLPYSLLPETKMHLKVQQN